MRVWFFIVMFLLSFSSLADLYKWVDEKGVLHYSDKPRSATEQPPKPIASETIVLGKPLTENQKQLLLKDNDEMKKLEAAVQKQADDMNKFPRKSYVGSQTKDVDYALYLDEWKRKVLIVGSQYYPTEAKKNHVYGDVRITVSIWSSGQLEEVKIEKSSQQRVLDDALVDTVKKASPFAPFSEAMKKKTDILSITTSFSYTNTEKLN